MNDFPRVLRTVMLAAFASMAAMRICDPMLVKLADDFSINLGQTSQVISAYALAYGVMQLVYGPFGDRLGKLRVITFALFACAAFSLLTAAAPTWSWLVAGRTIMGAAAAGIIPLSMAWVGDQVPYEQRQEVLARLMGTTLMGMMLGQWFGGWVADHVSWRLAFLVLGVLFLTAAWVLRAQARLVVATHHTTAFSLPAYGAQIRRILGLPRVRWVLALAALEGAIAFGALAYVPSHLVTQYGASAAVAGAVMTLYGIGGLVYSRLAKRWVASLGEQGLALGGGLTMACGLAVLAWASQLWLGAVACFLAGIGFNMLHNTLQTQATQMVPEARGMAVTFFASVLFLGQSTGVVLLASSLESQRLNLGFSIGAGAILVLGWAVSRRVNPKPPKANAVRA